MNRITINPQIHSGKPCIRGMRITVYDILEYLAGGIIKGTKIAAGLQLLVAFFSINIISKGIG